jgi:uncharacterized membrane protein
LKVPEKSATHLRPPEPFVLADSAFFLGGGAMRTPDMVTPPLPPPLQSSLPAGGGSRLHWVDVLRGLAIVLMVPANLAPWLMDPHPAWLRVGGSLAAPLFIIVSAGMATVRAGSRPPGYILRRALSVMMVGVLLDLLLWRVIPSASADVLYLIGVSMLVVHGCRRWPPAAIAALAGVFMAGAWVLQTWLVYDPATPGLALNESDLLRVESVLGLPQSWLVDGYFPIFPWLGLALFGAAVFRVLDRDLARGRLRLVVAGLVLTAAGGFWLVHVWPMDGLVARDGYSEIFYPPTPGFLAGAAGVACLLIAGLSRLNRPLPVLTLLGRHAMLVYILHQVFGVLVLGALLGLEGGERMTSELAFLMVVVGLLAGLTLLLRVWTRVKTRVAVPGVFLRVVLGI